MEGPSLNYEIFWDSLATEQNTILRQGASEAVGWRWARADCFRQARAGIIRNRRPGVSSARKPVNIEKLAKSQS